MDKMIYYRGVTLVTPKQKKLIQKLWGDEKRTPYNWFFEGEMMSTGTGIPKVNEIILYIENDPMLKKESDKLKNRISQGLTVSRSKYAYGTEYVESNILYKIMEDAIKEMCDCGCSIAGHQVPFGEMMRMYGIPSYPKVLREIEMQDSRLSKLPPQPKTTKKVFKEQVGTTSQQSTFKCYWLDAKRLDERLWAYRFNDEVRKIKDEIYGDLKPYIGKVSASTVLGEGISINVYDYANSNKVANMIATRLIEAGLMKMKK